jgi:hypothetical protein
MSNVKSKLRSITLGASNNVKSKLFEYEGEKFEFRAPSLRERKKLIEASKGKDGELDGVSFQINSIITLTYDPASGEKVFDAADFDGFMDMQAGGFVDLFAEEIMSLMSVGENAKKD